MAAAIQVFMIANGPIKDCTRQSKLTVTLGDFFDRATELILPDETEAEEEVVD